MAQHYTGVECRFCGSLDVRTDGRILTCDKCGLKMSRAAVVRPRQTRRRVRRVYPANVIPLRAA